MQAMLKPINIEMIVAWIPTTGMTEPTSILLKSNLLDNARKDRLISSYDFIMMSGPFWLRNKY